MGSNKFMKFASFGMTAGTSAANLRAIRGENGKILKVLNDMLKSNGSGAGSVVEAAPANLSAEEKVVAQNIYNKLVELDEALAKYESESGDENREAFAERYKEAGELINSAPIDIRGSIGDKWSKVDTHMYGLRSGSNKFMKFASFGMTAGTAGASLNAIRGLITPILKILKSMIEETAAPAVAASDNSDAAGFCTKCGAPLKAGDAFCGKCGAKIDSGKPSALSAIKKAATTVAEKVAPKVEEVVVPKVKEVASKVYEEAVAPAVSEVTNAVVEEVVTPAVEKAKDLVVEKVVAPVAEKVAPKKEEYPHDAPVVEVKPVAEVKPAVERPYPEVAPATKTTSVPKCFTIFGNVAFYMGIATFICAFIPYLNYVSMQVAVAGIVFSILGKKDITNASKTKKALVFNILGVALAFVMAIIYAVALSLMYY